MRPARRRAIRQRRQAAVRKHGRRRNRHKRQAFAQWYLSNHPDCDRCHRDRETSVPATRVRRIRPMTRRPDLEYAPGNCVALCGACHAMALACDRGEL